ncbi:hypothetical protein HH1059_17120 [Halorhodospira halochloris]|uniref:Uncharacterized protein n=1 Tax=Halorhodospira halochloris TaxID=1052 RepID=A0A2Z6EZK5_HALHR|nr:hypothetical protein [Halorhodospira halochloris]BBE11100.1 hypothetical protein HH1059_17120 [Halorhodospira halochloris]
MGLNLLGVEAFDQAQAIRYTRGAGDGDGYRISDRPCHTTSAVVLGATAKGASKNSAGATIRPGVEDAVNPSLEASWRHPWRQDLHTGADGGAGKVFRGSPKYLMCRFSSQ